MAGNPRRARRGYEMGRRELRAYRARYGKYPLDSWLIARLGRERYAPVARGYAQAIVALGAANPGEAREMIEAIARGHWITLHPAWWI